MAKRKVTYVSFKDAVSIPGIFGGEPSLSSVKQTGIEMYLEAGIIAIHYKNEEMGVPLSNVKSYLLEKVLAAQNRLSA